MATLHQILFGIKLVVKKTIQRKLAVIFATDVVGFSKSMETNEDLTLQSLRACKEILENLFLEHSGRIFNTAGDSVLAEFQSAVSATVCASEFQKLIEERNTTLDQMNKMEFRIGVNMGDVIVEGDNLYGEGVNVAARLEAFCPTGGIAISKNVYELIEKKVNFVFHDKGQQKIKNSLVHTFVISNDVAKNNKDEKTEFSSMASNYIGPTIAILPLKNLSNDPEQDYFADGVSEDLIAAVSKFKWVQVISRNSSFAYKNSNVRFSEIGEELGATYILDGSIRKSGKRVRITIELVELPSEKQLWTEKFDRTLEDIFDLQDEITHLVAAELEPELSKQERQKAKAVVTTNLGSWDFFQKAQWHIYQFSPDNIKRAIELYRQSIELDEGSSNSHSGLALGLLLQVMGGSSEDYEVALNEAAIHAKEANRLDDQNPFAFYTYGRVCAFQKRHQEAEMALNKAIALNPSYALAYHGLAQALLMDENADFEKALIKVRKAIELSPRDPLMWAFRNIESGCLIGLGKDEEALVASTEAISFPNAGGWAFLGHSASNSLNGNSSEAKTALDQARQMMPFLSLDHLEQTYGKAVTRLQQTLKEVGLE